MQGKKFMVSATWNAPKASFGEPSQVLFEGRSTADILIQITSNYRFCGVDIVTDYNCFDILKMEILWEHWKIIQFICKRFLRYKPEFD